MACIRYSLKKNSANKSLKESKAAIAKLMEEQPDAHRWESTSSIWDAATTRRRQELEKHARGNSSHDEGLRFNNGDTTALGKLLKKDKSVTYFETRGARCASTRSSNEGTSEGE